MKQKHSYIHRRSYNILNKFPRIIFIPALDELIQMAMDQRQVMYNWRSIPTSATQLGKPCQQQEVCNSVSKNGHQNKRQTIEETTLVSGRPIEKSTVKKPRINVFEGDMSKMRVVVNSKGRLVLQQIVKKKKEPTSLMNHFRVEGGRVVNLQTMISPPKVYVEKVQDNPISHSKVVEKLQQQLQIKKSNPMIQRPVQKPMPRTLQSFNQDIHSYSKRPIDVMKKATTAQNNIQTPFASETQAQYSNGDVVAAIPVHEKVHLTQPTVDSQDQERQDLEKVRKIKIDHQRRLTMLKNQQEQRLLQRTDGEELLNQSDVQQVLVWKCFDCNDIFSNKKSLRLHAIQAHSRTSDVKLC